MTFFLILGGFAALMMIRLLFRLAALSLPLYAGISGALLLSARGYGPSTACGAGVTLGLLVLLMGRLLIITSPSPLLRAMIALFFVIPAGFAGYQAAFGIAGLTIHHGLLLTMLAWFGGFVTAAKAWKSLVDPMTRDAAVHFASDSPNSASPLRDK